MWIEGVRVPPAHDPGDAADRRLIANAAEPWKVPDMADYVPFPVKFAEGTAREPDNDEVMPYRRNADLARPWIKPGTPGLEHRIGGIEKNPGTGNIDYSAEAHAEMTRLRAAKVASVADSIADQDVCIGNDSGKLVVVGWGSTYGPIHQAVRRARARGQDVSHVHIRYIAPFPKNLAVLLRGFEHILVPEMNSGQLKTLLRDQFLVDARPLNKVSGQPFTIAEIEAAIDEARVDDSNYRRSVPGQCEHNVKFGGGFATVKPINPWPLIAMLLLVLFLYLWLNGYLV
jgi:2-oxoglutarate ferredoxin oxidoreductase subunit alpha